MKKENKKKLLKENSLVMDLIRLGIISNLFSKYISGVSSPSENETIAKWDAEKFWNKYRGKTDKTLIDDGNRKVWEHVTNQILVENPALEHGNYTVIPSKPVFTFRHFRRRYAAAAVLFILLGGAILFLNQHNSFNRSEYGAMADANTFFQTTDAQIMQITLPDGSRIHLNRGTKISYASNAFNRKLREVWLSGEAFFEVAKNPEKPFIIHTGDMTTTVRGTSFNVKAYPQLGENVVSVKTGKVEVKAQDKMLAMLSPDKQLEYNKKTNTSQLMDIDADEATGWQSGGLILNYADKDELKFRIKQHYNADIQFRNNALDNIKIKSTFVEGTSLTDVLGTIEALYGVRCSTQNNQIIIDKQ